MNTSCTYKPYYALNYPALGVTALTIPQNVPPREFAMPTFPTRDARILHHHLLVTGAWLRGSEIWWRGVRPYITYMHQSFTVIDAMIQDIDLDNFLRWGMFWFLDLMVLYNFRYIIMCLMQVNSLVYDVFVIFWLS